MRISDWSSDLCSSDLAACQRRARRIRQRGAVGESEIVVRREIHPLARLQRAAPVSGGEPIEIGGIGIEQRHCGAARPRGCDWRGCDSSFPRRELCESPHFLTSPAKAGVQLRAARYWTPARSEEHTSELQSLMRISYAVFCLKKKKK